MDEFKKVLSDLKKRWIIFISIIGDPSTLLFLICVAALFYYSFGQTDPTITSLFFVLITFASAIVGGRITKRWVDITEGGVVIARGKSAVRSLKLLLRNISSLEKRVSTFSSRTDEIENHPEVIKRNYEEIREICNLLEEETVNSIENWTDIVPEADIKTQIGEISDLKQTLQETEDERKELKEELQSTKDQSEEDRKQLEQEFKQKEKEITKLEKEIRKKSIGLATGGILGLGGPRATDTLYGNPYEAMRRSMFTDTAEEALRRSIIDDTAKEALKRMGNLSKTTDVSGGTNIPTSVHDSKIKK